MRRHPAANNCSRNRRTAAPPLATLIALLAACLPLLCLTPDAAQADDEASCRLRQGAEAVRACTRLIQSGQAKGTTLYLQYNNRGGAHQAIGAADDHRRAIEDFGSAIKLDPRLPYAFINRGVSWASLGAYDLAIADFAKAVRLAPDNALAYNNRGGAYRDRGEISRALGDFNKAISLDPKLADARFNRGTVYMQKEDYGRAIVDYTAVIRQDAHDILALAARGRAWSGRNDFRRAKSDYEAALAAPAKDQQSQAVKDAVRELLRALIERKASDELEAAHRKQVAAEKAAAEKSAAKAAADKAAAEKQARAEKKASKQTHATPPAPAPTPPPAAPLPIEKERKPERLALVIGNAAYLPELGALTNPVNDARDMAKAFTELGFDVWLHLDLGHVDMKDVLARFARAARDARTVIFYYAGHGFQAGGSNYLAAVDAPITDDRSIANHLSLNAVMTALRSETGIRVVIIDACRNNLAVERAAGSQAPQTRATPIVRGLAPVVADSWSGGGMLIAFATLPGEVASEGAGRNSPFTDSLIRHLPTPGLELRLLFVRVRADVIAATGSRQNPEIRDALNGEYMFRALARAPVPARRR